ncbi:hypothetical protein C1894_20680 [Pseudomonas sp. FW305-3-2-15-E-TSA2]|nr:hypothetical protein C1895_19505 [Pseudomonas sp. FW305-3-2-15-E-TSA4]POA38917.1 hypothetical protein C1894_20680 [Pseudomonas sp. FW305-3-2-15-E-TSA2]
MGASLLAKAVCQPTSMSDVPASSRAGSLPQGISTNSIGHFRPCRKRTFAWRPQAFELSAPVIPSHQRALP